MTSERMRVTEAGRRLGLSARQVLRLVDDGSLKAVRDPDLVIAIPVDALDDYERARLTSEPGEERASGP